MSSFRLVSALLFVLAYSAGAQAPATAPATPETTSPAKPFFKWPSPNKINRERELAAKGGPKTAVPGMSAAATVGGLAATPGTNSKAFLDELWKMPVPSGEQRYFDGMLYLMSMLHSSGNFRIIQAK